MRTQEYQIKWRLPGQTERNTDVPIEDTLAGVQIWLDENPEVEFEVFGYGQPTVDQD